MSELFFSDIGFKTNLFSKTQTEATKSSERISAVARGNITRGDTYHRAIRKFKEALEEGLEESEFSWKEMLYVANELSINRALFEMLLEYDEFETFVLLLTNNNKLSVYKKMILLYLTYYSSLHKAGAISVLVLYIKNILRYYQGKNRYLNALKELQEPLFGSLPSLLDYFQNDFEKVERSLKLQGSYEFTKALLNLKIIQELKKLSFDEQNTEIFQMVLERKDIFFAEGLTLKEYVARYLIERAMQENRPFPNWQRFVLELMGDPRSITAYSSSMNSWDIIGEEKKEFFIKTLSKDDLKLFLDVLSDSVSDTNYHYRKAFWMPFVEKVIFAKIMISEDAFLMSSDSLKQRFKVANDSYGKLHGVGSQSAIYIDFGKIKIIEFTHNGQVRGFEVCPIDLHKKTYTARELNALGNGKLCIFSEIHSSPRTYAWQTKILEYMNLYLDTNVKKQDIEILADREKREEYARRYL